jgi:hypothetical protein
MLAEGYAGLVVFKSDRIWSSLYCIVLFKVIAIKQTAVTKKKDSFRAMALDSENNQIQVKDIVKVVDGPHSVCSAVEFHAPLFVILCGIFYIVNK